MPTKSIFHKLVKSERSYTQLLCNMLKRDEYFRVRFFDLLGISITTPFSASYIHAERHLAGCGQADILIDSENILVIIEVKTELGCRMTGKQPINAVDPKSYVNYLIKESRNRSEVWLVYLVPAEWRFLPETKSDIDKYKASSNGTDVRVTIKNWEDIATRARGESQGNDFSFADEFNLLLAERFGSTTFSPEEMLIMLSRDFPVEAVFKTIRLINQIARRLDQKLQLESLEDEFGFYIGGTNKQRCVFYVGWWLTIWEQKRSPICFGVKHALPNEKASFARSLHESFHEQEPIDDGEWIVGVVPEQEICDPDAVSSISGRIRKIFDSISQV